MTLSSPGVPAAQTDSRQLSTACCSCSQAGSGSFPSLVFSDPRLPTLWVFIARIMVLDVFLTVPIPRLRKLIYHSKLKWDSVLLGGKGNLESMKFSDSQKLQAYIYHFKIFWYFFKPILWCEEVGKMIYTLISNSAEMKYYFLVERSWYYAAFQRGKTENCNSEMAVFYTQCPRENRTRRAMQESNSLSDAGFRLPYLREGVPRETRGC